MLSNIGSWAYSWLWPRSWRKQAIKPVDNSCRTMIAYSPTRPWNPFPPALEAIENVAGHLVRKTPSLAQTSRRVLPYFFSRVKRGPLIISSFEEPQEEVLRKKFQLFMEFDVVPRIPFKKGPLNRHQQNKAKKLIHRETQKADVAAIHGDGGQEAFHKAKANTFRNLLKKNEVESPSLTKSEWEALDEVDFELIQEHLNRATELFNTSCFDRMQRRFWREYGVNFKESLVAEALAKSLAYTLGLDGMHLQLPVESSDGSYALEDYTIKQIFLGDSLPCYILEPTCQGPPPWIVIRGTVFMTEKTDQGHELRMGSLESILADSIDPASIAIDVIIKSIVHRHQVVQEEDFIHKENLKDIMDRWKEVGSRCNMAAHSLGGYFISDIAIRFPDNVGVAYGFNAPGMGHEMANTWEDLVLRYRIDDRAIVHFDVEGDIIPCGGSRLVGIHVSLELQEEINRQDPLHMHIRNNLNLPFIAQQIDVAKENNRPARRIAEFIRGLFGFGLKLMIKVFQPSKIPDWWKNSTHYRQSYLAIMEKK